MTENHKPELITAVIADDEPIMLMNMIEVLNSQPNCDIKVVGSVSDGFEAIIACREFRPDVVMLDIEMPNLDGLTAAQCIYEEGLADTIIILTAYDSEAYVDKASEIGVSGYLVKPIDSRSLVASIRVACSRSREMRRLQDEVALAKAQIGTRKVIERAKGKVMEVMKMTENEAYNYIREISKTKAISMKDVAEIILKRAVK